MLQLVIGRYDTMCRRAPERPPRAMRVALLCHKFWPAVGGLCTYTGRLVEYLSSQGHKIDVFTTKIPPEAPNTEQWSSDVVVRRFTTRLANHIPFHFMPRLAVTCLSEPLRRANVIHTVGYYFFPTSLGHGVAKLCRIPHVSTPVFGLTPETWQRRSFDTVWGRRLVRQATHVIPQSIRERDLLHAHGFSLPEHTIIPFGVDAHIFHRDYDVGDLRTALQLDDEPVLLFVGKIMLPKGAFDCLEVIARLRQKGRRLRLIMVGDPHERERDALDRRIQSLGLQSAVMLTGPITDRREIARYYQLSDVVLFPSQYEQFGIVAIEALASGRPVIGTPVGIMQDLIPRLRVGLLHPFGDLDRFETNLAAVLDDPGFRQRANAHRSEVLRDYDWHTISERTEAIYSRVAQGASRA